MGGVIGIGTHPRNQRQFRGLDSRMSALLAVALSVFLRILSPYGTVIRTLNASSRRWADPTAAVLGRHEARPLPSIRHWRSRSTWSLPSFIEAHPLTGRQLM